MRHLWMPAGLLIGLICLPVHAETLYAGATAVNLQPDTQQDVYQGSAAQAIYNIQALQAAYPPSPQQQELRAQTAKRSVRAALGFCYRPNSGLIYYVDQNCDLAGQIHVGDYLLCLGGCNPNEVMRRNQNFGEEGTQMQVTVRTQRGVLTLPCTRHPVGFFGPEWQRCQR
jgi:hypothetical protein